MESQMGKVTRVLRPMRQADFRGACPVDAFLAWLWGMLKPVNETCETLAVGWDGMNRGVRAGSTAV